jgi:hypothetical protein
MVGAVAHGDLFCDVPVRVDHFIRAVPEKEFGVDIPVGLADHIFASQLFHHAGNLQTALKIRSDADKAHVKVVDPQCPKHILIGTVSDLGADHIGKHLLQILLHLIHDHQLIAQIRQILAEMAAEPSHPDDQH